MNPKVKKVRRKIKRKKTEVKTLQDVIDYAASVKLKRPKKTQHLLHRQTIKDCPGLVEDLKKDDPNCEIFTYGQTDEDAALDIQVDTAKPAPDYFKKSWAAIVTFTLLGVGFGFGALINRRAPQIQYRDKIEYRYEVGELPENPWGPRKIPLLPEDVKILEGR